MKKILFYSLLFLLFFNGSKAGKQMAYKPIYISKSEAKVVTYQAPCEINKQGKIYVIGDYIFIGEINKGVHVIDNSHPESPQNIGFIQIYGNHDIAIKDHILFADNYGDMIAVDISNYQQPQITKRIEGVYGFQMMMYPPDVPNHTYFECVDPEKGYVIGWEQAEVDDPKCYTNSWLRE